MFLCDPYHENKLSITKINPKELTDNERLIGIFHWILGIKGKFWKYQTEEEYIIYSRGPYILDYCKTDFNKIDIVRFLPNIKTKRLFDEFFNDKEKNSQMINLLNNERNWYLGIVSRTSLL